MAADARARFEVELAADASGSDQLAASLSRLQDKIKADQKAIGELQGALRNLGKGASVNVEEFRALEAQIASKQASLAKTQSDFLKLGGSMQEATKQANAYKQNQAAARAEAKKSAEAQKAAQAEVVAEQEAAFKRVKESALKAQEAAVAQQAKIQEKAREEATKAIEKQHVEAAKRVKEDYDKRVKAQKEAEAATINSQVKAAFHSGAAQQAIVTAIAAVIAVAFVAAAALASFALAAADAARTATILRNAAAGSAAAGDALGAVVARVAAGVPMLRAEVGTLANKLAISGLAGLNLANALEAIAVGSSVMGGAAGSALEGIIERSRMAKRFLVTALDLKGTGLALADIGAVVAKKMGISVQAAMAGLQNGQIKLEDGIAALNAAVKNKYGDAARALALSLPKQFDKAKERIALLFTGIKADKLLEALDKVLSLLDESTVTGQALKVMFTTLLQPISDGLATAGPFAKAFFQGLIIGALMVTISVVKVQKALSSAFGGSTKSDILTLSNALLAGKVAFVLIGGAVASLTILLGVMAVAVGLVALPFVLAGAAIAAVVYGIIAAVSYLWSLGEQVSAAIMGFDLASAGTNLVTGFVNALLNGPGLVAQAAGNLARAALTSIASVLDSHSPSRATGKLAGFATQGFTERIEEDTPDAQAAMADMVSLPAPDTGGAPAAPAGTRQSTGGSYSYTFGDLYIGHRKVLKDPDLETELAGVFERARQRAATA